MKDHPRFSNLQTLFRNAREELERSWNGPVYRCIALKWARPGHLINGEGTRRFGSRWMRSGVTTVVHAASTEVIALKESRAVIDHFGIRKPLAPPRAIVELTARIDHVADLSNIGRFLPWPSLDELLNEDWQAINDAGAETLSQAVGRALFGLDFAGFVVPSARDRRGRNLVWFPEKLSSEDEIRVSHQTDLENWLVD